MENHNLLTRVPTLVTYPINPPYFPLGFWLGCGGSWPWISMVTKNQNLVRRVSPCNCVNPLTFPLTPPLCILTQLWVSLKISMMSFVPLHYSSNYPHCVKVSVKAYSSCKLVWPVPLAKVQSHPQLIFPCKTWFFGIYLNFQRQKSLKNQYLPHSEFKSYQINSN